MAAGGVEARRPREQRKLTENEGVRGPRQQKKLTHNQIADLVDRAFSPDEGNSFLVNGKLARERVRSAIPARARQRLMDWVKPDGNFPGLRWRQTSLKFYEIRPEKGTEPVALAMVRKGRLPNNQANAMVVAYTPSGSKLIYNNLFNPVGGRWEGPVPDDEFVRGS